MGIALPDDDQQPIHIQANSAERDERKGITTYTGNVIISQGSLVIEADKIIIYSQDNDISRIIATGKPAHFQQKPKPEKAVIHARGNTIRFFIDKGHVQLINNASLVQEDSTVRSDIIDYYINDQKIKASSSNKGKSNQAQSTQRVEVVIPPKKVGPQ